MAGQDSIDIHLRDGNPTVWDVFNGDNFKPDKQGHGFLALMCFHNSYDQIGVILSATCVFQHGICFAHTGSITEKNFQFPPVYPGFLGLNPNSKFIRIGAIRARIIGHYYQSLLEFYSVGEIKSISDYPEPD
jgi:hypothetical protein